MKKYLFILAAAALGFASCSNDDVIAENTGLNDANAISIRPFTNGLTRAADVNLPTNGFYVTALKTGQTPSEVNTYFDNVHFTGSGPYTSTPKYYWPSDYNLDFYAYSPATGTDLSRTDYKTFVVKSNATVANQIDFVYANTNKWGKKNETGYNDGTAGVTINFRHAESKIIIKLKNENSNLKFTIGDVSICNLYNQGTFTYSGTNTDTQGSGTFDGSMWGTLKTNGNDEYTAVFAQTVADGSIYSTSTANQAGSDMILIPQALNVGTTYSAAAATSPFNNACIKVQLKIQNSLNNAYIVGGESTWETALWPLTALTWAPGYKYTYTVDLAGGGYYEANHDSDADLDPILEGAEIKFVTVTVDNWVDGAAGGIYTTGL